MSIKIVEMNKKNSSNTQKKYFQWTIKIVQMDKKQFKKDPKSSNGQKIC